MLVSKFAAMFLAVFLAATPVSSLAAVSAGATSAGIPTNLIGGLASKASSALSAITGLSTGGIVSALPLTYFPCDGYGVLMYIIPKGFTPYAGPVMWLPGTKPNSSTFSAPPLPGMQILGKVLPGPLITCFVGDVPVGAGLPFMPTPGFGTSLPLKI